MVRPIRLTHMATNEKPSIPANIRFVLALVQNPGSVSPMPLAVEPTYDIGSEKSACRQEIKH